MSGVIVVDAESFRSTCHGCDAYINYHSYIFSVEKNDTEVIKKEL